MTKRVTAVTVFVTHDDDNLDTDSVSGQIDDLLELAVSTFCDRGAEIGVDEWRVVDGLSTDDIEHLRAALESHVYWNLSEMQYRNDGYVLPPGADDLELRAEIGKAITLDATLGAMIGDPDSELAVLGKEISEYEASAREFPLECVHCGKRMRRLRNDDPAQYVDDTGSANCTDAPNHQTQEEAMQSEPVELLDEDFDPLRPQMGDDE